MKFSLLVLIVCSLSTHIKAQTGIKISEITGDYCEIITASKPLAFNSKQTALVYFNDEEKILSLDNGTEFTIRKANPVPIYNAFFLAGWELKFIYDSKRGDQVYKVYVFQRKK